jgi:hypothetical protein
MVIPGVGSAAVAIASMYGQSPDRTEVNMPTLCDEDPVNFVTSQASGSDEDPYAESREDGTKSEGIPRAASDDHIPALNSGTSTEEEAVREAGVGDWRRAKKLKVVRAISDPLTSGGILIHEAQGHSQSLQDDDVGVENRPEVANLDFSRMTIGDSEASGSQQLVLEQSTESQGLGSLTDWQMDSWQYDSDISSPRAASNRVTEKYFEGMSHFDEGSDGSLLGASMTMMMSGDLDNALTKYGLVDKAAHLRGSGAAEGADLFGSHGDDDKINECKLCFPQAISVPEAGPGDDETDSPPRKRSKTDTTFEEAEGEAGGLPEDEEDDNYGVG